MDKMMRPDDLVNIDFSDEDSNTSGNPTFKTILDARISRRRLFKTSAATVGTALLGSFGLAACGGDDDDTPVNNPEAPNPSEPPPTIPNPAPEKLLQFTPVAKSLADAVSVPDGYTARVLYALGDPLAAGIAAYRNDGNDTDFDQRAGDHHDGMEWFGLGSDGRPSENSLDRGLLAINHEATTDESRSSFFLHADGGTSTLPRPAAEIDKETAIHGVSVVEVHADAGAWSTVPTSTFNFRLTALSDIELSGPARGDGMVITKYSGDGTRTRGTLNNCGTGKTPWGTFLTGEENWSGYFTRSGKDDAVRNDKSVIALQRYGRAQGTPSRHGWESGGTQDRYARWDISKVGTSTDGSDDYRNEINGQGYMVEVDVYDRTRSAKKRTGLGRFAHESAAFSRPIPGQPIAAYMGDDSRGEYIYKWVSEALWDDADLNPLSRMAAGDKYLDHGTLYVAQFNSDGSGDWLPLNLSNAEISSYAVYAFANQADVAVHSRLAADAVGATRMDRPEWCSVNPANGEIYIALTNNSSRRIEPTGSQYGPDSANPRVYTDLKGSVAQEGNPNGHIIRIKEDADRSAAVQFAWDVYLFAAEAEADASLVNLSNLTSDQDLSSPDGLIFSKATGICWIQTDDGAYTDVTNCMMLAALPGAVGDGGKRTLSYTKKDGGALMIDTFVGAQPTDATLKRFLVGPVGCEITGLCETPDGKTVFINVQHPGESTKQANIAEPEKYTSQWPSNAGYGPGKRPRSATIVITKNDGGKVGT